MEEFKKNADRIISEISERKNKLNLIEGDIYIHLKKVLLGSKLKFKE